METMACWKAFLVDNDTNQIVDCTCIDEPDIDLAESVFAESSVSMFNCRIELVEMID
jgi:hypothetical protein